jgi:hypothetical protein
MLMGNQQVKDLETYISPRKVTRIWRCLVEGEYDPEIIGWYFKRRMDCITSDQDEYFKKAPLLKDAYNMFIKQSANNFYREGSPLDRGDLIMHHKMLSYMFENYWLSKLN